MSAVASTLKCPVCSDQTLESLSASIGSFECCPNCHGLLLPQDVILSASQDRVQCLQALEETKNLLLPTEKRCPKCTQPFFEGRVRSRGVIFTLCPNCQTFWTNLGILRQFEETVEKTILIQIDIASNPKTGKDASSENAASALRGVPYKESVPDKGLGSFFRAFARVFDGWADRFSGHSTGAPSVKASSSKTSKSEKPVKPPKPSKSEKKPIILDVEPAAPDAILPATGSMSSEPEPLVEPPAIEIPEFIFPAEESKPVVPELEPDRAQPIEKEPEPVPLLKPEPEPIPQPEPPTEPIPVPMIEPEIEKIPEPAPLAPPESEIKPPPELIPEPLPEPEVMLEPVPKPDPEREPEPVPIVVPEPSPQPVEPPAPLVAQEETLIEPQPPEQVKEISEPKEETPKTDESLDDFRRLLLEEPDAAPEPAPKPIEKKPQPKPAQERPGFFAKFKSAWSPSPAKPSAPKKPAEPKISAAAVPAASSPKPIDVPQPKPTPQPKPIKPPKVKGEGFMAKLFAPKKKPVSKPTAQVPAVPVVKKVTPLPKPKREKVPREPIDPIAVWPPWGLGLLAVICSAFRDFGFETGPAVLWGLAGWSIGFMVRLYRLYPFKPFQESSLQELSDMKESSSARGLPVILQGQIVPADEQDPKSVVVFKQEDKTIPLNRLGRWDVIPRFFGLSNPRQFLKGDVALRGWYRSGLTPFLEVLDVRAGKVSRKSMVRSLRWAFAVTLFALAIVISLALE